MLSKALAELKGRFDPQGSKTLDKQLEGHVCHNKVTVNVCLGRPGWKKTGPFVQPKDKEHRMRGRVSEEYIPLFVDRGAFPIAPPAVGISCQHTARTVVLINATHGQGELNDFSGRGHK